MPRNKPVKMPAHVASAIDPNRLHKSRGPWRSVQAKRGALARIKRRLCDTDDMYDAIAADEGVNMHFVKNVKRGLEVQRPWEKRMAAALKAVRRGESITKAAKEGNVSVSGVFERAKRTGVQSAHARAPFLPADKREAIQRLLLERSLHLHQIAARLQVRGEVVKYWRQALVKRLFNEGRIEAAVRLQWHTRHPSPKWFRNPAEYAYYLRLPTEGKRLFREFVILRTATEKTGWHSPTRSAFYSRIIEARKGLHTFLERKQIAFPG